ncbi:MAG: hypothetical protein M3R01_08230 [Actinomycetota bacterium]|nr:hypothetical protein [Actinomycetota bacterium]
MTDTERRTIPFSDVDALMRVLDEPRRPQTIQLEVAVDGRLDEGRLRDAVAEAARRHPMARARQLPAGPFDPNDRWEIADGDDGDVVEVCAGAGPAQVDAARDAFYTRHIDVSAGPPFRVLLVHGEHGADHVMLAVSHVAFDGIGTLRLLQSVSRIYAGHEDAVPDIGPMEARRNVEDRARRRPRHRPGPAPSASFGRPPARLAASPGEATQGFGILHLDLDDTEVASLGAATVNDVLLAAMHLTIDRWNRPRCSRSRQITLMMPVNQRPPAWRGEVVANLVLSSRVESTSAERERPEKLMAAIAAQTRRIKADGGETPITIPPRTPVVVRRLIPRLIDAGSRHSADTAVLSNLGRVEDPPFFGAKGTGLWFSPPPRDPVILTMGAATADGRLGISLRWCNAAFSTPAAREFADLLRASLAILRVSIGSA